MPLPFISKCGLLTSRPCDCTNLANDRCLYFQSPEIDRRQLSESLAQHAKTMTVWMQEVEQSNAGGQEAEGVV